MTLDTKDTSFDTKHAEAHIPAPQSEEVRLADLPVRPRRGRDNTTPRWWAMSAIFNRSIKAREALEALHVETYVPMKTTVRTIGRRKVRAQVPAVSNLIFVRATDARVQEVKDELGFLQFLCNREQGRGIRIVVPDDQMQDFMRLASDTAHDVLYLTPGEIDLKPGDRVRIHGGAFDGVVGTFQKVRGKRSRMVVVSIPTVLSVATLSFSPDLLEKVTE